MLWLALYFPRLSMELIDQAFAQQEPRPALAISNATHVLSCNRSAGDLGVQPSMKRATALALAPELKLFAQDRAREQQALETLALSALQFTPQVSLQYESSLEIALGLKTPSKLEASSAQDREHRPAGLLLEIEASLLLFGGQERLLACIQDALKAHGFHMILALAPYARSAWLLTLGATPNAREQVILSAATDGELNARLAPLPLTLLRHAQPHLELLETMGVRSIKDLVQLPRAGVARRFGKTLLTEIDQALGKQAELRHYFEAPLQFKQKLELLADIENAQALLFAAQRLIQQLCQWLALQHAAVSQLELLAEHQDHAPTSFQIRLTQASRDPQRLVILLRERLNVSQLRAPAHTLILSCQEVVAMTPPTQDLFPLPQTARESLGRLVERLQVRLGREQVQRVLMTEDHRPEASYELRPLDEVKPAGKSKAPATPRGTTPPPVLLDQLPGLPRPLWFFPKPLSINERQNRPFYQSTLNLLAGPERIESGWWDRHLVQRDYFIAEDAQNNLYWLYRQRFPTPGWFIQGRFG